MNYGQKGKELLLDLKRSDWLPPYNENCVRGALQEITSHFKELNDEVRAAAGARPGGGSEGPAKPPMESRPALILHDAAIRRNKRCLLAYHNYRLEKIKAVRWETGAAPPPEHLRSLLSEAEMDFLAAYDRVITRQSERLDLDLMSDPQPPGDDLVEVRVVRPGLGTIVTDSGAEVALEMGTTHHLPRADVEHLVRQASLQQLDGEENT